MGLPFFVNPRYNEIHVWLTGDNLSFCILDLEFLNFHHWVVTTPLGVVHVDKIFHDFPPEPDPATPDHFIPMHSSIIDTAINNLRRVFVLTANKLGEIAVNLTILFLVIWGRGRCW